MLRAKPGLFVSYCLMALLLVSRVTSLQANENLAPGFVSVKLGDEVLVVVPDVELFSISGGGVSEPKADWSEAAQRHISEELKSLLQGKSLRVRFQPQEASDDFAELGALHAAVASSIAFHHFGGQKLPTKGGVIDWSLGDATKGLYESSGAKYGLFIWVRDSYASSERKAAMIAFALLGVGMAGGLQTGYASLIDLSTGRVVWFNRVFRGQGDLRERDSARETVATLLKNFPTPR